MIRKSVAGAILGISLLVASFAWSGFVALRTVFDPDRSAEVAEELLDNDEVSEQVAINLATAIDTLIPPEVPVSDEVVVSITQQVLQDPAVEAILLDAFVDTHRAFLGEGDAPEVINLTGVAQVARQRLIAEAPRLESLLPESPSLVVPLPTEYVPDAGPVRRFTERAVPILALVSIGGAVLALVASNERPSILRRAGRWALVTTVIYLILGLAVPALLREFAPDQAEVVAALMSGLLRSVLIPSIVLGVIGLALLLISLAWAARTRSAPNRAVRRAEARATQVPVTPMPTRAAPSKTKPDRRTGRVAAGSALAAPPSPVASPYPDSDYQQSQAARDWGPSPSPYPDEPAQPAAVEQTNASVFADVPLPGSSEPVRPAQQQTPRNPPVETQHQVPVAPPVEAQQPFDESRSVFASPPPSTEQRASAAAPPAGARWSHEHGWILDPDNPNPLPPGAVWVDGVGYVLPVGESR